MPQLPRTRVVVLAALASVLLSACRLDFALDVLVEEDGSGRVDFTISVDDEVLDHVSIDAVDLSDIGGVGWEVTGPVVDDDGARMQLSKPVPSAGQFGEVIDQLDQGRFYRDADVTIDIGLGTADYTATLTVDPMMTVLDFSDAELRAILDGEPFGEEMAVLEARAGGPLDEAVFVSATLTMPDGSTHDATVTFADGAPATIRGTTSFVDPTVDERRLAAQEARETFDDSIRTIAVFWGIAAFIALVLLTLGWRRRRVLYRQTLPPPPDT